MYDGNKILAVITARGGSKGIPKKNLIKLNDKALIAYSIENGMRSKYVDDVYVSSDSDEILTVARRYGAETIKRPDKYATDTAQTLDVIKHTVAALEEAGKKYDWIVLLQPTSPLITSTDVDQALEQFGREDNDVMIPVTETHAPPDCLIHFADHKIYFQSERFLDDPRRQNLPKYYTWCGAIFIYLRTILPQLESYSYIKDNTGAYIVDKHKSFEVDTLEDLFIAESILKNQMNYERYKNQ